MRRNLISTVNCKVSFVAETEHGLKEEDGDGVGTYLVPFENGRIKGDKVPVLTVPFVRHAMSDEEN